MALLKICAVLLFVVLTINALPIEEGSNVASKTDKIPIIQVPEVLNEVAAERPQPKANCSDYTCDLDCRKWGYKGGMCTNMWTCQCYK